MAADYTPQPVNANTVLGPYAIGTGEKQFLIDLTTAIPGKHIKTVQLQGSVAWGVSDQASVAYASQWPVAANAGFTIQLAAAQTTLYIKGATSGNLWIYVLG